MCWGEHESELIGDTPRTKTGISGAKQIVTGSTHTCVLVSGRRAAGVASRTGSSATARRRRLEPGGGCGPRQGEAADGGQCLDVRSDHRRYGQLLGNNRAGSSETARPRTAEAGCREGLTKVQSLDAGGAHTCALLSGGKVKCWGGNRFTGALGDGTEENRLKAVAPKGL